jgi:adenylate cyclase
LVNALKIRALLHWLAAGAPPQTDYRATVGELCSRMVDAGIAADLFAIYQAPLNPLLGGLRFTWNATDGVKIREFSHAHIASEYYIGGVIDIALSTGITLRYRVGEMPQFDEHPGSETIIKAGIKEFNLLPLRMTTNFLACLGVAVRRADGLPEDQFKACRRLAAPLARVVQSQVQLESTNALLAAYLGRDAGAQVSAGMVKRGDAKMIRAVILFTDLVNFADLSNSLAIEDTVATLNRYFEALETPISKNGGEVLKLIGDGLLAVFPTPDDLNSEEGAALSALSAVADARTALSQARIPFRAAFHVGEIHYGNIGGLNRLDFTAIGASVNLASRLLEAASRAGVDATCSADFARLVPDVVQELGEFDLKGFDTPQLVYDASSGQVPGLSVE